MKQKSYALLDARFGHKAGTTVYPYNGYDYGLSNDDSRHTGYPHTSVSLTADGDAPFFTVQTDNLIEIV